MELSDFYSPRKLLVENLGRDGCDRVTRVARSLELSSRDVNYLYSIAAPL